MPRSQGVETIGHACPVCDGDLYHNHHHENFLHRTKIYTCIKCNASFRHELKIITEEDQVQYADDLHKAYVKTIVGSLVSIAKADGQIDRSEQELIDLFKEESVDHITKEEAEEIISDCFGADGDAIIRQMLIEAKKFFTKEMIMTLLAKSSEIAGASGQFSESEEAALRNIAHTLGMRKNSCDELVTIIRNQAD